MSVADPTPVLGPARVGKIRLICRQHGEPENSVAEELIALVDEGNETQGVMKMILE